MHILFKNCYVVDFVATVMFFTRIPINWPFFFKKAPDLSRAAWAFPLAGLLIGVLSGVLGDFLIYLGLPIFISCIIAITLSIFLTGAFHEDGLADTADGLGAGGSPEVINKIIHDSRLGTYGVVALVLGLLSIALKFSKDTPCIFKLFQFLGGYLRQRWSVVRSDRGYSVQEQKWMLQSHQNLLLPLLRIFKLTQIRGG